jgi:hypothetical protein
MINISFTNQELDTMLRLFDMAVKAQGLNAAGAAFILQQKIMAAFEDTNRMMVAQEQGQPDRENN